MIGNKILKKIIKKGKPEPKNIVWWGEPNLGGWYEETEIEAVVKTINESNNWMVGFGPNSKVIEDFENAFADYCGVKKAVAISSCGVGLDMALMSLNLKAGDEVISPAINYKAAHLSILHSGGKVVFCDIDPKTLNLDLEDVKKKITPKTKAILPVSAHGLSIPIDELTDLAKKHGQIKVIVDAARCCGGSYKDGSKVGSKGWVTVFSFHSQKHMTTLGEGGMITTNDKSIADKFINMRAFGGEHEWGSNYKMTKVQAAVGVVQLNRLDEMNKRRIEIARNRSKILSGISEIELPENYPGQNHLYYVYPILVRSDWQGEKRDKIISIMREKFGVACSITNPPTYLRWPYIAKKCGKPNLEVSEEISERLFCPPIHPLLTKEQELYICASLIETINLIKNNDK